MVEFSVDYRATEETREQYAKLAELGEAVKAALTAAEDYAREHKLSFYFSPEYGMGGDFEGSGYDGHVGWSPSAHSC